MRDIATPLPSCESSLSYAGTHCQVRSSRIARRVAGHLADAEELTFPRDQPGAAAHDRTPAVPALSATVKLGAVTEDGRFHRWLTHDEIAGAVLSAIDEGRDIVAGTLPG